MLNFKSLMAGVVLSSVAALSFAQAPAAPAEPLEPTAAASAPSAKKHAAKKTMAKKHAAKKVSHQGKKKAKNAAAL